MADIQSYLNEISNARYGKDVRKAMHDGIKAINEEVVECSKNVAEYTGQIGQLSSEIENVENDSMTVIYETIANSNYANTLLSNANDAKVNTVYRVQTTDGTKITNLPDVDYNNNVYFLVTLSNVTLYGKKSKTQYFFKDDLTEVYSRVFFDGTWYAWNENADNGINVIEQTIYKSSFVSSLLSDANNAKNNSIYRIQTIDNTIIPNLPNVNYNTEVYFLITFYNMGDGKVSKTQYFVKDDLSAIYNRVHYDGVWYEWKNITDKEEEIVVGANQQYTSLKSAIEYAYARGNVTVRVLDGEYDIVSEYGGTLSGIGLMLGNNVKLYFSPKAKVLCNYIGGDGKIQNDFSVFNAGDGDFEIHNLNIACKNTRYCVHDELYSAEGFRIHKYVNCNMYLDNRESQHFDKYRQCIGGGLGTECLILIEGGNYKSEDCTSQFGTISYHNGSSAECKSKIVVKDVYFDGEDSTIRFGYYGDSTEITDCYVSGCSMSATPIVRAESDAYSNVNMVMKAWNNEIRQ